MKLSSIKSNPNNPRLIKDERFKKLVKSIEEFLKMLKLRPIIIDQEGMILGGNMRFKALKEIGYKEIPDDWFGFMSKNNQKEISNRMHPSQKPTTLIIDIINQFCKNNIIVDIFLGSGTTMVAFHKLNRTCYGMELSPEYC
jgi:DNA modification methylase